MKLYCTNCGHKLGKDESLFVPSRGRRKPHYICVNESDCFKRVLKVLKARTAIGNKMRNLISELVKHYEISVINLIPVSEWDINTKNGIL